MFLQWSEADQDKALQFHREQNRYSAEHCPDCGAEHARWEKDRFAYVAVQDQCPGCEVLEMERENTPDEAKGVKYRLVTREEGERLTDEIAEPGGGADERSLNEGPGLAGKTEEPPTFGPGLV